MPFCIEYCKELKAPARTPAVMRAVNVPQLFLDPGATALSLAGAAGAVSAELATEMGMRICASVLYEGIFEGRVVRLVGWTRWTCSRRDE
jgi:hypothetical protein